MLRFGLDEVGTVDPQAGEDEELKAEEGVLAHAESLARAADLAHGLLVGDAGQAAARTQVAEASAHLQDAAGHDPVLDALTERVLEVGILIDEVGADLGAYSGGVDLDPERLAALQDRRAALAALQRKYGPTLDDVLAWAEAGSARLGELGDDD